MAITKTPPPFNELKQNDTRCRFCQSTKCHTRIYTRDGSFDELACWKHTRELELLADEWPDKPGVNQVYHISGIITLKRGVYNE